MKLMKSNCLFLEGQTMNRNEKITILSFDETSVSHKICFDKRNELNVSGTLRQNVK